LAGKPLPWLVFEQEQEGRGEGGKRVNDTALYGPWLERRGMRMRSATRKCFSTLPEMHNGEFHRLDGIPLDALARKLLACSGRRERGRDGKKQPKKDAVGNCMHLFVG